MKTWFTKEFMKASAVLFIVFAAGAGTGYIGGRKNAEYKLGKERKIFSARESRSRLAESVKPSTLRRERSSRPRSVQEGRTRAPVSPTRSMSMQEQDLNLRARFQKMERAPQHSRRARGEKRFMRRLERDLNLNPAQRDNVDRVLQRHYERIRDIRNQLRPQINSIMQEIRKDVRSFLDNEQKISFDLMVKKFEERRKRRWRKGRKHHPGDPAGPSKK